MTQRANPAANGLCAVRSSVAEVRERAVRSNRASEAVADLCVSCDIIARL